MCLTGKVCFCSFLLASLWKSNRTKRFALYGTLAQSAHGEEEQGGFSSGYQLKTKISLLDYPHTQMPLIMLNISNHHHLDGTFMYGERCKI